MGRDDPRQVAGPSGESSRKGKGKKRKGVPEKNKKKSGNKKAYVPSYVPEGEKCVVCGDYSTGSHYRAMTCEGCKGFFRRTIQKSKGLEPNLVCKREQKCEISPQTRNACQYCRYKKCLAARMDPNSVLTEKQRRHLKILIDSNRIERQKKEYQTLSPKELSMLLHIGNSYKSAQVADFYKFIQKDDIDAVDQAHSETNMSPSLIHVIRFVWSIPGIQKMNEDDLIKLFYNHLLDIVGFRLAELFDPKKNELRFKNFHLRESELEKYSHMEEIFNFAKYYAQFVTTDGVILGCMCAIRFLSVDNATLVSEKTVSKNVEVIQNALLKYLAQEKDIPMHSLFSRLVNFENIREYHSKLLTKLSILGSCSENVFGLSFNPDYSEMFGLGQVKTFEICSSPSSQSDTGANSNDDDDEPMEGRDFGPSCSASACDSSGGDDSDRKQPKKADKGKRLVSKSKKHQPKRTKDCSVQANTAEVKKGEGSSVKTECKPLAVSIEDNLKSVKSETASTQASSSQMFAWNIAQAHDPICGQSSFGFANMPRAVKVNLAEIKCQPGPSQCQSLSDSHDGYTEIKQPSSSDMNRSCEDSCTDIKPPINLDSPYDVLRSCEVHLDSKTYPRQEGNYTQRKENSIARQHGVCSPQTREVLSSRHKPRDIVPQIENEAPQRQVEYCIPQVDRGPQKPENSSPRRPEAQSPLRREESYLQKPAICAVQRKDYVVPPTESALQADAKAAVQALLLKNAELEAKLRRLQAERRQGDNSEGFNLHLTTNEKVRRISYMSTSLDLSQAGLKPPEVYSSATELHHSPLYCSLVPPQYPGTHALPPYPHLVPLPPVISLNGYSPVGCSQTQFQPYSIRLLPPLNPCEPLQGHVSPVLRERPRHLARDDDMINAPLAHNFATHIPEPNLLYRNGSITPKREDPTRAHAVTQLKGYDLSTSVQAHNLDLCQVVDMSIAKPRVIPADVQQDARNSLHRLVPSSSVTRYDSSEDLHMQRQQNTVIPIASNSCFNTHEDPHVPKLSYHNYKNGPNENRPTSNTANNLQSREINDRTYHSPGLKRTYCSPGVNSMYHSPGVNSTYHSQGVNSSYHSPGVNSMYHSPGVNSMYHSPGVNSTYHSQGDNSSYHSQGDNSSFHSPVFNNTNHSQGVNNTNHSPGVNSTYHSPGVNSTYHSPGVNNTNHSPGVNNTNHSPGVNSTNHSPGVNSTNHSPGVNSTNHSPGVNNTNHSPGVNDTNHSPGINSTNHSPRVNSKYHSPGVNDNTCETNHDSDTGVSSSQGAPAADSSDKNKTSVKGLKKRWLEDYSHDP